MTERQELEKAMAVLDGQRTVLGDVAVEAALAGLQHKLATLEKGEPASPELAGERRVVTVLFCDVKGSTAMAEKLDPEDWAGIMKRAMMILIPPVTRHDGTVARLMGDAILAFFGAPTAHEDDPQRAVRAGLEIVEGIRGFRAQLQRERGLDFNVRVGINTGSVFVGAIGADRRIEYTAVGDTMNLAARMEQTALPGTVQITEQTFKLVEAWFDFDSLGGIQVKGKTELINTYRPLRPKSKPHSGRGLEGHGLAAPLVGRERELQTLESCIGLLATRGDGGILGIIGEAGLGKSRLVTEAKAFARAHSPNVLWLEGQTLSFGQTISYWPFQQILRGWAGITEEDDGEASWSKLEQHVRALFGEETIEYLPYLASLLAIPVQGEYAERVKYLDGDAMGKQIFLTSRRFFERLARTQPTILVFEDLHWMDESSTLLLEHLLPLVETVPLIIFGNSRPERETPAARVREVCLRDFADHYTEIRLAPLSEADSAELIDRLLNIENMPVRLRDLMVDKADGNPFFLEEVLRTLMDAGALIRDPASGRWRATAQIETIQIPNTIEGVIMARMDRLDEELKQVLRVASVIGRNFLYRILQTLTEAGHRLDTDLLELQASEMIHEKKNLPELQYMFKHALAQEATYASILLTKRRELHARVAGAIESLFAERLDEFYGLLAYHYAQAETWDKAQDYMLKAADRAGQMAADAEALNLYQQAMAAYGRAFGAKWDPAQRASLERKMGEVFLRRGEHAQATEHFGQALGYLGYPLPISRGEVRAALLREVVAHGRRRLRPQRFDPQAALRTHQSLDAQEWLYNRQTIIDGVSNPERFLLLTLRQFNSAEQRGSPLGVVFGCYTLGIALDFLGLFDLAGWYHRRGLDVAENLQLPSALGSAHLGLQFHELYRGAPGLGLEHGQKAVEQFNQTGDIVLWSLGASLLAWMMTHLGDLTGTVAQSKELIRIGKDAVALDAWCWGETTLGSALRRQGKLEEAIAHLQKAIDLAETTPDHIYRMNAGSELALCYLHQGNSAKALSELETCLRVRAEHRVVEPSGYVKTLNNLAETHLWIAEQGDVLQKQRSLDKAKSACDTALKEGAKHRPSLQNTIRLRGTYEWLRGKPAAAQKWWNKSLAEAERMGLRYDEGLIHLELGQCLGEREHLEKAETIFAEIGAEMDLANTRKLRQKQFPETN